MHSSYGWRVILNRRQPAVLVSRNYVLKNGRMKTVLWHYLTDRHGKSHRYSMGTSSKSEAKTLLYVKVKAGDLQPARGSSVRLQEFTCKQWDWDRGIYIPRKRLRGECPPISQPEPRISGEPCSACAGYKKSGQGQVRPATRNPTDPPSGYPDPRWVKTLLHPALLPHDGFRQTGAI